MEVAAQRVLVVRQRMYPFYRLPRRPPILTSPIQDLSCRCLLPSRVRHARFLPRYPRTHKHFLSRTYLVTKPINVFYYTQLIGNPRNRPTILAAASFKHFAVVGTGPTLLLVIS